MNFLTVELMIIDKAFQNMVHSLLDLRRARVFRLPPELRDRLIDREVVSDFGFIVLGLFEVGNYLHLVRPHQHQAESTGTCLSGYQIFYIHSFADDFHMLVVLLQATVFLKAPAKVLDGKNLSVAVGFVLELAFQDV